MKEPLNVIICGVGGQGNVLIGGLIGEALIAEGYFVTTGETYGVSQRGGAVTSHIRISREFQYGPLMENGSADVVLGLEPLEALRALGHYGNPGTKTITNTRPIYPITVLSGEAKYPSPEDLRGLIDRLSHRTWLVNASDIALKLGDSIMTNIVMAGALVGTNLTPLSKEMFEAQLRKTMSGKRLEVNLSAFNKGFEETYANL